MTEIEALNALKLEGGLQIDGKAKRVAQFFEGLSVAEEALTEIQAYRAIGTVESLKNLPAICDSLAESSEKAEKLIEELKAYRAIGTIEELKAIKSDGGFTDDLLNMGYTKGIKDGYNKAIDEFAEKLNTDVESFEAEVDGVRADLLTLDYFSEFVFDVAEQMKGEQHG